jgi:DNA polymerase III delta prime subunit
MVRWTEVASQYRLSAQTILNTGAEISSAISASDKPDELLWRACRTLGRRQLDDLAQRVEPVSRWKDLILPEHQKVILSQVASHVRNRLKVCDEWGFASKSARGMGLSTLFAGESGTGKTMAAEVLANELHLDLYRIDLSSMVSKYIGETEKNLRKIFDAAEDSGVILLFDEADALFGKRSEVKDSHDRYANIEVSYLLQRMEAYTGLAILTTNLKTSLDTAFQRRLRFVVQFTFPDTEQREAIWRSVFPSATPTQGLDYRKLAQLQVAGGNIRNIALNAAFLAADSGEAVGMVHLLHAAHGEGFKARARFDRRRNAGVGMKRVVLHIDSLVLKGFRHEDRHGIAEGLQQELSRLFADPQAAQQLTARMAMCHGYGSAIYRSTRIQNRSASDRKWRRASARG